MTEIDKLSIATIRSLVIDITNKANSGHPGMAIGSAPLLYTLFTKHLIIDPKNPTWINRDRFVLSSGHASALLYTMLHLSGYEISIDDLKSFRQIDSVTPGHPEYRWTSGVDATSGPLGQGIAQAVGMAIAEESIRANYIEGEKLCNHYTYCLCGDGCLEEGISQESISLAGHQKLNKLILFYDANNVTLDGALKLSFSEDVKMRFIASGWNVIDVEDGNDVDKINDAIVEAKKSLDKPTMICLHTIIGYGASKQGTSKVHGSPIGYEDGKRTKVEAYGFDHEDFYVPQEVYKHFEKTIISRGIELEHKYHEGILEYSNKHNDELIRFQSLLSNDVNKYLNVEFPEFVDDSKIASRVASGKALNFFFEKVPMLFGGSADVAGSVMTKLEKSTYFTPETRYGHDMNWGIREFAMAGIQNGILLHGGIRTYVGCFCVFSDYMKPAIRLASLSKIPAIYIFSHDSIALGEDGPTHQPVEQIAMLRSIPNMQVIRPCDERETYGAWLMALKSTRTPTSLILSRQGLPLLANSSIEGVTKGAYIISNEIKKPRLTIIATGSEVSLALDAQKLLLEKKVDVRVVSMPSWELFAKQDIAYQKEVLGNDWERCVSVEMLSTFGWQKWAKFNMGIDTFGASAPIKDVVNKFNFTADRLKDICLEALK